MLGSFLSNEDICRKMSFTFRHCLKGREGVSPYFWPFFHQVKVTKIGTFLLKIHNICMFFFVIFVIIIIRITFITIIIIIAIIIIIIGNFFLSYA